jgi:predicted Zn-dependent peptidase
MNRKNAPDIKIADSIVLPTSEKITLDNGIPVYMINAGEQEVVKLDFVFEAGKWYEPKNLLADFVNRMMREGVKGKSAKEVADILEFYGCNLESSVSFTNAGFQLYSLPKHLPHVLPLLLELFTQATFADDELETMLHNRKQKHTERLAKNEYVCNRHFLSAMWGAQHPYGRVTDYADFEGVTPALLREYYQRYYHAGNCFVIVAGRLDATLVKSLNEVFGSKAWLGPKAPSDITHTPQPNMELILHTDKPDSVQSALMVGNATINKYHPDFDKLSVLNTAFGGYFGSRLMANIREDKGYTYGIHSSLTSYQHGGILEISAEVGKEVRENTLKEIAHEIDVIRTELLDDEELNTVKNYLTGRLMRSVDGPLKYADILKGQLLYGRDATHINEYLHTVQHTTAAELRDLAQLYLRFEQMYQVTVG